MPPPSMPPSTKNFSSGHAVTRSNEFLSCCRTAFRISQQQKRQQQQSLSDNERAPSISDDILSIDPSSLKLYSHVDEEDATNTAKEALRDAVLTLNLIDSTLSQLSSLVKRRGHTNDPTEEINSSMSQFHQYAKEMMEILQTTLKQGATLPYVYLDENSQKSSALRHKTKSSSQRIRHYTFISECLQAVVEKRMKSFKDILEVRGNVIKDQTQRRKRLLQSDQERKKLSYDTGNRNGMTMNRGMVGSSSSLGLSNRSRGINGKNGYNGTTTSTKLKSQMASPLFSSAVSDKPAVNQSQNATNNYGYGYGGTNSNQYTPSSQHTGITSSAYGSNSTGLRQRNARIASSAPSPYQRSEYGNPTTTTTTTTPQEDTEEEKVHGNNQYVQSQIQTRRQTRQTQSRLDNARLAEKSLAELTNMFSKMSSLIQKQGETLVKIEDDVEAAAIHVDAGAEEIDKLYEFTKGNRGLILKVFGILIFFVIFMKWY